MNIDFERVVALLGPITFEGVAKILADLEGIKKVGDGKEETFLIINSGGGAVDIGNMAIDLLPSFVPNLVTVGSGLVGSMAIPVFLCGKRRIITRHTRFFFHDIGRFYKDARLGVGEVESDLRDLSVLQNQYVEYVVSRTNGKMRPKYLRKIMKQETFLYPDQLIEHGLVDGILN